MPINRPYTSIWVLEECYRSCIYSGPLQTVYKLFYGILCRRTGYTRRHLFRTTLERNGTYLRGCCYFVQSIKNNRSVRTIALVLVNSVALLMIFQLFSLSRSRIFSLLFTGT